MANRIKEFIIPEMSNYDANEDAKQYEKMKEAQDQDDGLDGMDFEVLKADNPEEYVSPEEASPEALKRIKSRKIGGFINNVLGRVEAH